MTAPRRGRAHFFRAACVVVGVSLATMLVHHLHLLDRFETTGLDAFVRLPPARDPNDLVIVSITDEDYNDPALFNATSPLNCRGVQRLLRAIAAGNPMVIGVDLDTAADGFACLEIPADWPPIVWAEDAVRDSVTGVFNEVPVLAGRGPMRTRDRAGIAQLPQDGDGVIRRYYRELPVAGERRGATFPWAVIEAACEAGCAGCCAVTAAAPRDESLRLNFAGERFDFKPLSVRRVLQMVEGNADLSAWHDTGPLTQRIVLLGGSYRPARDSQVTPIGPMNGVQILAQAIESELHGGGIRPLNEWIAVSLDLASGFLLVGVGYWLRARAGLALLISVAVTPLLCLVGSFVAFSTLSLWFNFVPVILSVILHELYEHAREYRHLRAAS